MDYEPLLIPGTYYHISHIAQLDNQDTMNIYWICIHELTILYLLHVCLGILRFRKGSCGRYGCFCLLLKLNLGFGLAVAMQKNLIGIGLDDRSFHI